MSSFSVKTLEVELDGARIIERREYLLVVTLPIRTTNPLNGGTGNTKLAGIIRSRDRARQRGLTRIKLAAEMHARGFDRVAALPVEVTLTRVSFGHMDDDGLAASFKGVRDGIADALGIDDGSRLVRWVYGQRRCKRTHFGVEIRIESRRESAA